MPKLGLAVLTLLPALLAACGPALVAAATRPRPAVVVVPAPPPAPPVYAAPRYGAPAPYY